MLERRHDPDGLQVRDPCLAHGLAVDPRDPTDLEGWVLPGNEGTDRERVRDGESDPTAFGDRSPRDDEVELLLGGPNDLERVGPAALPAAGEPVPPLRGTRTARVPADDSMDGDPAAVVAPKPRGMDLPGAAARRPDLIGLGIVTFVLLSGRFGPGRRFRGS